MIYLPVAGAFFEAIRIILEKKILIRDRINFKNFTVYLFLSVILIMLPFIYLFWKVQPQALSSPNIAIFIIIVFASILANMLMFYSLKREKVTEIEPVRLMQPLFVIFIAYLFSFFFEPYAAEKNISILFLAIIASISLIASHIKKHHFVFNKCLILALIASFLFALELVMTRAILDYYNPLTFYFIRGVFIFLITWIAFQPHIEGIKSRTRLMIFITGAIWVLYRIIIYYGYLSQGIIFTTTILILAPIFIFIFAVTFLKEKVTIRHIVSSIIIIICVIAAIIIKHGMQVLAYLGLS
jgi:drug/metabolite transporter (DMT)-like permease